MENLGKHQPHYYCPNQGKPCVYWVAAYFDDCLCTLRDDISFFFGFTSLLFWGLAEIPQIFTNYTAKSSHGVSLPFLLAWIVGDVFNLIGCVLEPATLPTQFYTALLYTVSTVVLVLQSLYYDYICHWLKYRGLQSFANHVVPVEEEVKIPLQPKSPNLGIPVPDTRREYYFMSARSLAGSNTPSPGSWFCSKEARSGPSILFLQDSSSSDEESSSDPMISKKSLSQPLPIPLSRSGGARSSSGAIYTSLLATALYLPTKGNGFSERLYVGGEMEHGVCGQWLGWVMAAIYMGGRVPQILLNIKRGSVEVTTILKFIKLFMKLLFREDDDFENLLVKGLNPLMFAFALVANVTYVGSILVRTMEWEKLKANMPWLLDAVVCVGLDLLIILQYIYYKGRKGRRGGSDDEDGKLNQSILP